MHGEDVETLQQRADIAMYSAKQSGRGYAIFEPELDRHSPRRLALAGGLRSAINEGQIELYYQPKADLRTGRIMRRRGARALGSPASSASSARASSCRSPSRPA